MRVFVMGATGALGRFLVPGLVAAGHEVTAATRAAGKVARLRAAGAEPVVVDGLDRGAVIAAVAGAAAGGVGHQMSALGGPPGRRQPGEGVAGGRARPTRGPARPRAAGAP